MYQQFDLTTTDKIDHIVLIAAGVDVCMAWDVDRAVIECLALQHVAQLALEVVCLWSLLNRLNPLGLIPRRLFRQCAVFQFSDGRLIVGCR